MTDLPFQDRLKFDRLWRSAWRLLSSARLAACLPDAPSVALNEPNSGGVRSRPCLRFSIHEPQVCSEGRAEIQIETPF